MREANQKYLNDVEDRMDSCHDPIKILTGAASHGRSAYANGGEVKAVDGMLGSRGRGRRMIPVDQNPNEIKTAMMATDPNSPMAKASMMRAQRRSGPQFAKGGSVTCENDGMNNNPASLKGMPAKMGLTGSVRTKRAMGGVGKIRHEQYD